LRWLRCCRIGPHARANRWTGLSYYLISANGFYSAQCEPLLSYDDDDNNDAAAAAAAAAWRS
jgi:hypothetical protein